MVYNEKGKRPGSGGLFMGFVGFVLSLVAGGFMLIGLIPLLGWLNWFTTLPLAVIAGVLCAVGVNRRNHISLFGLVGLIISILVFIVGASRLFVGCGIF
jgi:hypothetical protein